MLKVIDRPAFRETGKAIALVLKPLPLALICEIVSKLVPLFVI